MFNVSIREYFSVLNVFIVCMRNTARSKSISLMCTHVDLYKFSTVHPPKIGVWILVWILVWIDLNLGMFELELWFVELHKILWLGVVDQSTSFNLDGAGSITPPRWIRYVCYDLHVLPFVDIYANEHNDHIGSGETIIAWV
jgi:hypothetical protein